MVSKNGSTIPSKDDNNAIIWVKYSTSQGKVTSESGAPMEVCVSGGGISDIHLGRTMEDDGDYEIINDT